MVYDVIQTLIDDVSDRKVKLNGSESAFLKDLLNLPEGERTLVINPIDDEKVAYDIICKIGHEQDLIKLSEKYLGYPFINISSLERKDSIDNLARSSSLAGMGVFSTIVEEQVTFVISNKDQINAIKENCDVDDFKVYICWPWEIEQKNKELNLIIQTTGGELKHVVMATGQRQIDTVVGYFNGITVDETVEQRKDLLEVCKRNNPNILIVSDNVGGNEDLMRIILKIKKELPNIRIIYFTKPLAPRDEVRKTLMNTLIDFGIYDIIFDNKFSLDSLKYLISTPKTVTDMKDIIEKKTRQTLRADPITLVEGKETENSSKVHAADNVYSFISSKGGTGKSFLVGNIAKAIGKVGVNTSKGKPNVLVVDGDFFGGGISNMFNLSDEKKNIFTAINIASRIFAGDKRIVDNNAAISEAIEDIKGCLLPLPDCKNVQVLSAYPKQFTEKEFESIKGSYIQFVIEALHSDFDVVLMDITGDFELQIWYPLFEFSRIVFSVVDMEFNAISNCVKQEVFIDSFLEKQKGKMRFMVNKAIDDPRVLWSMDDVRKLDKLDIAAEIPYVNRIKMLNDAFQGKWLVDETSENYENVKLQLYRAAQQCWPIKGLDKVEKIVEKKSKPKTEVKSVKDVLKVGFKALFPFAEEADEKLKKKEEILNEIEYTDEGGEANG